MAVAHVVAVGAIGEQLVAALAERIPGVKVGDGLDPESQMGPLVTREHLERVASYIDRGREQGATVVVDGRKSAPPGDGFFIAPSLLDLVSTDNVAYKDEIFGPLLGVSRVA